MLASNLERAIENERDGWSDDRTYDRVQIHRLAKAVIAGVPSATALAEEIRSGRKFNATWEGWPEGFFIAFGLPSISDMPSEPNVLAVILRDGRKRW